MGAGSGWSGRRRAGQLAVVVLMAFVAVGFPAGRAEAQDVAFTFDPDPPLAFEPFAIGVDAAGCEPFEEMTVDVSVRLYHPGDPIGVLPVVTEVVTADASGVVSTTVDVPFGYTGWWWVGALASCGGEHFFEIDPPSEFGLVLSGNATVGEPFSLVGQGTGCVGPSADWELHGIIPIGKPLVSGTASVEGGAWRASIEGVLPADLVGDRVTLTAVCHFVGGELVQYPESTLPVARRAVPPFDPGLPGGGGVVSEPRYTG